jgi:hypothetical protein
VSVDLAQLLIEAILAARDQVNASHVARGVPGRIEIHVNPAMQSVVVHVVADARRAA